MESFDVVVVGARCAGASLATFLARAGIRVCLIDRARFPSEVPSTHAVQPNGVHVLRRLGVAESLAARTTPVRHGTMALDDLRIPMPDIDERAGAPILNVRRSLLDTALVEAAAESGVDVRARTPVTGLIERDGRVAGVETPSGPVGARLVVGADGCRSTVARLTGAAEYATTAPGRIFAWAYFDGASGHGDGMWFGRVGGHAFLASPTDDDLFMVAASPSISLRDEVVADPAAALWAGLDDWPELKGMVADARRVGPVKLVPRWHGYFRRSAGPGWALVGDAGHFKDPTLGQGIADALRQSSALAEAVAGADDVDAATHGWWRWRDRDAWAMYWFSAELGADGPLPALSREMVRLLADDPTQVDRLMRVFDHQIPPSDVFTPGLALRAAATAWRPGARRSVLREATAAVAGEIRQMRRPRHPAYRPVARKGELATA